ncbi:MAG: DNA repair protein RecN [Pseudomonadota bacterium]
MLTRLVIRNIVLIEALDLSFAPGFTALTGETGAGKSILLDALGLALGGKADGGLVRRGEREGAVSATFAMPGDHPARALLAEADIAVEDDDLIIRRSVTAEGRAKAFVNDQPVTAALLKSLAGTLIEVHGQHADRALTLPSAHRRLVDAYGGLQPFVATVAEAWTGLKAAEEALGAHEAMLNAAREEADYLRASVEELSALDPEPGEEERLSATRQTMAAAEKVAGDLAEAAATLEGSRSPVPTLAGALRKLERKAGGAEDLLNPVMDALAAALDTLEDARATIADAQRSLDYDAHAMEGVEERLFALRAAARKYQCTTDDLADTAVRMAADLADLDAGEERLAALSAAVADWERRFREAAASLSEKRVAAAGALEADIARELPALKLEKARFEVRRTAALPSAEGIDTLEFIAKTNPGSPPGPITKVASGGEFSRFLLSLKVSLADRGSASTMIFDEIDTGVGGAVSDAIGARMARLADAVQVIAITHAPQVAARAQNHLLIAKRHAGETTATGVAIIDGEARREEIARMLAGATITDEARAAADRLIEA